MRALTLFRLLVGAAVLAAAVAARPVEAAEPDVLNAALVAVLSRQPQLAIRVIDRPVTEIHAVAGYVQRVPGDGAYGWLECSNGHVDLLVHNGNPGTLLHEALHAADCVDDGAVNGSLLPHACSEPDCAHEWIGWAYQHHQQAIEIMACSIRPHVYLCKGE